jgi:hypothetical protein
MFRRSVLLIFSGFKIGERGKPTRIEAAVVSTEFQDGPSHSFVIFKNESS